MQYAELNRLFLDTLSDSYPDDEIRAIYRTLAERYEQLSFISLHLGAENEINPDALPRYLEALETLKKHVPIQYITGEAWFMDLKLKVSPDVLIPRPETEELVNLLIEAKPATGDRILDLCTGSGCIALAAAFYYPETAVWAVDISEAALGLAAENAESLGLNVNFSKADVLSHLPDNWPTFKWILSNPPYIPQKESATMAQHVTLYEPHIALFVPEENPLLFYKALRDRADQLLESEGTILMECHEKFTDQVAAHFLQGGYKDVQVLCDLSGKQRFVKAIKTS